MPLDLEEWEEATGRPPRPEDARTMEILRELTGRARASCAPAGHPPARFRNAGCTPYVLSVGSVGNGEGMSWAAPDSSRRQRYAEISVKKHPTVEAVRIWHQNGFSFK